MNVRHLLRDTVHAAEPGGTDEFGNPTYGAPVAIRCRLEHRNERTVDRVTGQEVVSTAQFVTAVEVGANWRVWLPGADTSDPNQAQLPKNVARAATLDGRTTLWQVFL